MSYFTLYLAAPVLLVQTSERKDFTTITEAIRYLVQQQAKVQGNDEEIVAASSGKSTPGVTVSSSAVTTNAAVTPTTHSSNITQLNAKVVMMDTRGKLIKSFTDKKSNKDRNTMDLKLSQYIKSSCSTPLVCCIDAPFLFIREFITLLYKLLLQSNSVSSLGTSEVESFTLKYSMHRKIVETILTEMSTMPGAAAAAYIYSTIDEKFDLIHYDLPHIPRVIAAFSGK